MFLPPGIGVDWPTGANPRTAEDEAPYVARANVVHRLGPAMDAAAADTWANLGGDARKSLVDLLNAYRAPVRLIGERILDESDVRMLFYFWRNHILAKPGEPMVGLN